MKLRRIAFTAAALCLPLTFAAPAQAQGIPVIDIQAIIQAVAEVSNTLQEIDNQITQISQLDSQIKAITGARGLGAILNNPLLQNYLPPGAAGIVNDIQANGTSALTPTASTLRRMHMTYNCENLAGVDQSQCQSQLDQPYQSLAFMQDAIATSNNRLAQIESLMSAIDGTTDAKGVAEIQARVDAENAMLGHVQTQMQMATGMAITQEQIVRSKADESRMQQANRTGNLADFL
jgi:type IV secretion system protein VirB5